MENKTLFRDMIPYRAGIVRITPLDSNSNPLYDKSYTTARDFLTSTQRSTSYSYETFHTSNGDACDYITQRRENITLTTQIYDPRFDALISGKELVGTEMLSIRDIQISLPAGFTSYIFNDTLAYPAASSDGEIYLEIRDAAGNKYNRVYTSPSEYQYRYNQDTYRLEFSRESYARAFSCVYYIKNQNQEAYASISTLKNKLFMIEAFGEMQSASNGIKQVCYTCVKRATVSSDITGITRQKSIDNKITYSFSSAPVKRGESPCIEMIEPIEHNYDYSSVTPTLSGSGVLYYENQTVITLNDDGILVIECNPKLNDSGILYFS